MLPKMTSKDESFNSSLFGELSPISSNNSPDEIKTASCDQKMCIDESAQFSFRENEIGELWRFLMYLFDLCILAII